VIGKREFIYDIDHTKFDKIEGARARLTMLATIYNNAGENNQSATVVTKQTNNQSNLAKATSNASHTLHALESTYSRS